jgi:hypothetical protein
MKTIDSQILANLLVEYQNLTTKKQKSEFYSRTALLFGLKEKVFKDRFYRYKQKQTFFKRRRVDYGVTRLDVTYHQLIEDMKIISSIKLASSLNPNNEFRFFRNRKFNSTSIAIEIAYAKKLIQKKYSVSTVNSWIKKLGLNYGSFFRELASIHLVAGYSNDVWLIDATPLQSIYLDRNARLIYDTQIGQDKNHGNDILVKRDLRKVWLYFVVDKFSGAFLVRIYIGEKLGENEHHWAETLRYAMSKKSDYRIPLQGIPNNIYSDAGASKGSLLKKYFEYFDILSVAHAPGNSKATGSVEARIGSFKRTIETLFNSAIKKSEIHNSKLESLIEFCDEWSIYQNQELGLYDKYRAGLSHIAEVTEEHYLQASSDIEVRSVDNFGEVDLDGKQYYVNIDLVGTKVQILRRYPNRFIAKDIFGSFHECSEQLNESSLLGETRTKLEKSRFAENKKAVIEKAKEFKKNTTVEDLLPSNIFALKDKNIVAYSIKSSWEKVLEESGYSEMEIPEDYKVLFCDMFYQALETKNHVSREVLDKAVFLLNKYMKQNEANQ